MKDPRRTNKQRNGTNIALRHWFFMKTFSFQLLWKYGRGHHKRGCMCLCTGAHGLRRHRPCLVFSISSHVTRNWVSIIRKCVRLFQNCYIWDDRSVRFCAIFRSSPEEHDFMKSDTMSVRPSVRPRSSGRTYMNPSMLVKVDEWCMTVNCFSHSRSRSRLWSLEVVNYGTTRPHPNSGFGQRALKPYRMTEMSVSPSRD